MRLTRKNGAILPQEEASGVARLLFEGAAAPIAVPDTPEFLSVLSAAAPGWPVSRDDTGRAPIASVARAGDAYELRMDGEEPIRATAVTAACGIMVEVLEAGLDAEPDHLCLHCGSVEFAGRLVVFPSRSRAGKSTLVARLAASGHRIFGDDVLPLSGDDSAGLGTGLAPRLRLPLPASASDDFRAFVARRTAAEDGRYLYLDLPQTALAARHEAAPLGAVVLLDRREDGPAFLSQVRRSLVLRELILQNFAQEAPASQLLERIHRLMDGLPAFALHYSDLDDAAALLEAAFTSWPPQAEPLPADDPRARIEIADEPPAARVAEATSVRDPGCRFRRAESVALRTIEGETFLALGETGPVHQLNPLGGAIWMLMAEATSLEEAEAILAEAFPETPIERIRADLAALFTALEGAGFIRPDDP